MGSSTTGTIGGTWHTSFTVSDIDTSIAFYRDVVGLDLVTRQTSANEYIRRFVGYSDAQLEIAQFAIPGAPASTSGHVLEIIQYLAPKGNPVRPERCDPGASHLAFQVDELEPIYRRLKDANVHFVSDPVDITEGVNTGGRTVYLHDPDGVTLELVQLPSTLRRHVVTRQRSDGRDEEFLVDVPGRSARTVAIIFHPFGFDPEAVLDGERPGERLTVEMPALAPIAARLGVAVVAPRAVGRATSGTSLAWREHIDAAIAVATDVASSIGAETVVSGGLSMGGLEALVAAARSDGLIQKVWAANPIVDLRGWIHNMRTMPIEVLLELGVDQLIEEEVGSDDTSSVAWTERNPLNYIQQLAGCEVRLDWSPDDSIIPNQATIHAGALARELRSAGATVHEMAALATGGRDGRAMHETWDVWSGLTFLTGE